MHPSDRASRTNIAFCLLFLRPLSSWQLQPDEFALATADVPGWVADTCQNLRSLSMETNPTLSSRKAVPKRPRNPPPNAYNRTQPRMPQEIEPLAETAVAQRQHVVPDVPTEPSANVDEHMELERDVIAAEVAGEFEDENFRRFIDCLRRFVAKGRHGDSSLTSNPKLLSEIRQNISIYLQNNLLHHVPEPVLKELMNALAVRVQYANEKCGDKRGHADDLLAESLLAVECAVIILSIFVAPGISRTVLVEERLDDASTLLESVCVNVVYPSLDPLYRAAKRKSPGKTSKQASTSGQNDDEEWDAKHTSRSSSVSKKMHTVMSFCGDLYDLLGTLALEKRLAESLAFKMSTLAMGSLRISGIPAISSRCVSFVANVYISYPRLDRNILNDLLDEISFLPPTRRTLRTYRVIGSETTSIRTSSAMSMFIVQVAASRKCEHEHAEEPVKDSTQLLSGFKYASKFVVYLVHSILSRVYQDRDSEYRAAVLAFLEDMMKMYGVPEWPAADIILRSFSIQTVNMLEATGKNKMTAIARALGMDFLGAIASKLSSMYSPAVLKSENRTELVNGISVSTSDEIRLLRYLQEDSSMNGKEHPSQKLWEAMMVIDDLQSAEMSNNKNPSVEGSEEDSDNEHSGNEDVAGETRSESPQLVVDEKLCARKEALALAGRSGETSSKQDASRSVVRILGHRGVSSGFDTILNAILSGLHDSAPTVRARAVKGLSHLQFDKATTMEHYPDIFSKMENGSRDVSTLVRDGSLDFLGRFLSLETGDKYLQMNSLSEQDSRVGSMFVKVFSIVDKRLKDRAVSVRKRAINIFRKLAEEALVPKEENANEDDRMDTKSVTQDREKLIISICSSLVGRLDDPETSVRDVSEKTVRFSLFGIDHGDVFKFQNIEEYGRQGSRRLVELFKRLPWNAQQSLLERLINKAMKKNHQSILEAITKSTVDRLHQLESLLAEMDEKRRRESALNQQRVACASILSSLCVVEPSLVAPHCAALAPSLSGILDQPASENDILVTHRILKVLECGIPFVVGLEPEFLHDIVHDVEAIVCQYPRPTLEEPSIRCLCALVLHANSEDCRNLLLRTANTFLSFLSDQRPALEQLSSGQRNRFTPGLERNARGAMVRLSLLLRYGNFNADFVSEVYEVLKKTCGVLLMGWSDDAEEFLGSPVLLSACVMALLHFLIRHRSFLPLGTATILDFSTRALKRMQVFRADRHAADILLRVLQGFHEMLRNEEERNSTPRNGKSIGTRSANGVNGAHSAAASKEPSLAAEEDAEAGYLAVCAQALLPALSDACTSHEVAVRRCVATVLGLLTRQGLVLPATIVSPLFSLLTDIDVKCREDSYRVVAFLADRHSSMLASAALPAIRNCFFEITTRLQHTDREDILVKISSSIVDPKSGFTLLSPALVLLSRDYRQSILEGLLREFDPCATARVKTRQNVSNAVGSSGPGEEEILDGGGPNGEITVNDGEPGNSLVGNGAPDDGDMLNDGSPELELYSTKQLCSMSMLAFVSIALACLDYSSGAGLGGNMKLSGGTAAADAKLKAGRDDITEICAIATRIISNSGQAVLRVVVQRMNTGNFSPEEKRFIADHSIRLCLLLRLKNHLTNLRNSNNHQHVDDSGDDDADAQRVAPTFSLDGLPLTSGPLRADKLLQPGSDKDCMKQIVLFRRMMNADSIDACDVNVKQSRTGKGSRRMSRSAKRSRSRRETPSTGRVKKSKRSSSARGTRRKVRYDSEDDGSDYVPH